MKKEQKIKIIDRYDETLLILNTACGEKTYRGRGCNKKYELHCKYCGICKARKSKEEEEPVRLSLDESKKLMK